MTAISMKGAECTRLGGALVLAFAVWVSPVWAQGEELPPVPPMPTLATETLDAAAPAVSQLKSVPTPARVDDPGAIRVLLSPELETLLSAQMVGRISELNAGLGQRVAAGEVLLKFDCAEAQARLRMAQAEASAARETLNVKQRLRQLEAAGDTEVALARAEVQKSAAAIEVAKAQLMYCEIKAPFDGRIVRVAAKLHQSVSAGMPLLELVGEGPLKLRLNVPSRMLSTLAVGTPIEVDILETAQSYPARVTAVNGRVDAVAQTIELEARLQDSSSELLPGMSGVARFVRAEQATEAE